MSSVERARAGGGRTGGRRLLLAAVVFAEVAGAAEPPELRHLRQQRDSAVLSIRHEADAKLAKVEEEYVKALDELYRRLVAQNNPAGAAAVLRERDAVAPDRPRPEAGILPANLRFSWAAARSGLSYRYRGGGFAKRAYDYSDNGRTRLLDGEWREVAFEGTVAWDSERRPTICFEFAMPVRPSKLRVHVLGDRPQAGYRAPRSIVVSDGDRNSPGREIGAARSIRDRTDWVDVDLNPMRPTQFIWITLEKGDSELLCVDEVEFR